MSQSSYPDLAFTGSGRDSPALDFVGPIVSETTCLLTSPQSSAFSSIQPCPRINSSSAMYLLISFILAIALIIIAIFGIIGNLFSIAIFSLRQMRVHSINVLLCGLAVTDLLVIMFAIPIGGVQGIANYNENYDLLDSRLNLLILFCLYPLAMTAQSCSIWILVLITVERFWAVCYPLTVARRFDTRKAHISLFVIFASAIGYNFIRFWEIEPMVNEDGQYTIANNLKDNRTYMNLYFTGMYLVFMVFIPFLILTILNGYIIAAIRRANQQRRTLSRQQASEHKTTIMMILIVIIFIVCNISPIALNFVEMLNPHFYSKPVLNGTELVNVITNNSAFLYNDVCNLLVVINSATTCILYWNFSQRYRAFCKLILKCQLCCRRIDKHDLTRTHTAIGGGNTTKAAPLFSTILGSGRLTTGSLTHNTFFSSYISRSNASKWRPSLLPSDNLNEPENPLDNTPSRPNGANPRRAIVEFDKKNKNNFINDSSLHSPLLISSHLDLPQSSQGPSAKDKNRSRENIRDRAQSCNGQLLMKEQPANKDPFISPSKNSTRASVGTLDSIEEGLDSVTASCNAPHFCGSKKVVLV